MNTDSNNNPGGQEPAFNAARLTIPVDLDMDEATKKADEFLESFSRGMQEAMKVEPHAEGWNAGRAVEMQREDTEQRTEQFMADWRRVVAYLLDIRNAVVEIRDAMATKEQNQ